MVFDVLLEKLGQFPIFDIATVSQISDEPKQNVRVQLHRWIKSGRLLPLRRGMYTFADRYRRQELSPLFVANEIYRPSYLSGLWVLSFFGLIPEMVTTYTSVTPRVPRSFTNYLGTYRYSHVKQGLFFGFGRKEVQGHQIWLADPEKALLDYWHLESGEWTKERLMTIRFQQGDMIELQKLLDYAGRFSSPRLLRTVQNWSAVVENT